MKSRSIVPIRQLDPVVIRQQRLIELEGIAEYRISKVHRTKEIQNVIAQGWINAYEHLYMMVTKK